MGTVPLFGGAQNLTVTEPPGISLAANPGSAFLTSSQVPLAAGAWTRDASTADVDKLKLAIEEAGAGEGWQQEAESLTRAGDSHLSLDPQACPVIGAGCSHWPSFQLVSRLHSLSQSACSSLQVSKLAVT